MWASRNSRCRFPVPAWSEPGIPPRRSPRRRTRLRMRPEAKQRVRLWLKVAWRNWSEAFIPTVTFLMSWQQRKPQPRDNVLKISTCEYWRLVKHWFWHFSPAGQTCGWHSYSSMRLMHSESMPQGFSSVALQLQRGISDKSAVMICTLPIGRFTCWDGYRVCDEVLQLGLSESVIMMLYLNVFVRRRLLVISSVLLELTEFLLCLQFSESFRSLI